MSIGHGQLLNIKWYDVSTVCVLKVGFLTKLLNFQGQNMIKEDIGSFGMKTLKKTLKELKMLVKVKIIFIL